MPELPEVETVKNTLKNFIIGRKITDIIIRYDKIIKFPSVDEFSSKILNERFTDIRRYGKYLLFDLESYTLVSHLRMEGKYFIRKKISELTKHEHIVFKLDNGDFLSYHDIRKFGTMELANYHEEDSLKSIKVLGKEINDPNLDTNYLYPLIEISKRPIKSLMLNQHIVTGLGNIYVDETLYLAKINPKTPGNKLNIYQVEKIIKSARKIIAKAIDLGGTTIRTYQSSLGVDGRFQNELNVHTLVGKKCKNCNDYILKTRVGGRGTYYCPTCQREDYPLIIALTGGIASGKSIVSKMYLKEKIKVIDADKIYKSLLKNNKVMYNNLVKEFGKTIVIDNKIDRFTLGDIIFNNKEKRNKLNQITHPFVIKDLNEEIKKANKNKEKIIVLDIPLLFEANLEYLSNLIQLIYVDKETQIDRLMKRDKIDRIKAILKINTQIDLTKKKDLSDIIIDNSKSIEYTNYQFKNILNNIRGN